MQEAAVTCTEKQADSSECSSTKKDLPRKHKTEMWAQVLPVQQRCVPSMQSGTGWECAALQPPLQESFRMQPLLEAGKLMESQIQTNPSYV